MLNILQHYQKYYEAPCPINSKATSPSQLCAQSANQNPKFRRGSNCIPAHPGQLGVPHAQTSQPQQSVLKQKQSSDLWIGVF